MKKYLVALSLLCVVPSAHAQSWINISGAASGTPITWGCLAASICYGVNSIKVTPDSISVPGGAGPFAFQVEHNAGGAGLKGNAGGIANYFWLNSVPGDTAQQYVGFLASAASSVSAQDSSIFGVNSLAWINGGTTWNQVVGAEIDVACMNCGVRDKIGQQIVVTSIDNAVGSRSNIGYLISNGSTSASGWDCGYCAGAYAGYWPISSVGTIIGAWPHAMSRNSSGGAVPVAANAGTAMFGLDWSNVTFAAGGAPIVMPLITPSSSSSTCRKGSLQWDANYLYICTATNTWKRSALSSF
jgi:hypothetical protein